MKHIFISLLTFSSLGLIAQNNVGIGTLTPNPQAVLDIESNDKGVLISRLTTTARNTLGTALTNAEDGMLVYDKDLTTFFYWDGPNLQWVQVGSGNGDNWGTQVVQTTGTNISGDGTAANPLTVTDNDNDPNNEIELPATANNGEVLTWDGTNWIPQAAPSGADNWGTDVVNTTGTNISGDGTVANPLSLTEVDGDITNEIQDLSLNTTTNILTITNNGTATNIDLSPYIDNTDAQTLSLTGNTLTISNGNNVTLTDNVNDADADPNNEIELPTGGTNGQVLSTDGSGNYTWINDNGGSDNQDLSLTGNSLSLTNDGTPVDLSGYLDNTDSQNLTSTVTGGNATINISGGTGTTFSINDADADPTNEHNTGANLTGNNLNIIDGGGTQTVDLSGLKDHDWYEVGGTTQPDNINDNIYTQGNVGIGTTTPIAKIHALGGQPISATLGTRIALFDGSTNNYDDIQISAPIAPITGENGTMVIEPRTIPGTGTAQFTTWFRTPSTNTGSTRHNVVVDGNIGINTTTPSERLHIEGNQYMHDPNQSQIHLASENNTSNHSADIRMTNLTSGNGWIITEGQLNADDNFTIQSFDNSNTYTSRFYINHTNGNTGINTNAPTSTLDVNGNLRVRNIPTGAATDEILVANATGDVRKFSLKMTDTWQAIGTTNIGTTTKSWVDMPNMLLNINLVKEADVSISWDATLYTGGGGLPWGAYRILVDGTPVNWGHMQANASWDQTPNLSYIAQNLAAGNHVIKVQWAVGSSGAGDSLNNAAASSTYLGGTNIWSRQLRAIAYYY